MGSETYGHCVIECEDVLALVYRDGFGADGIRRRSLLHLSSISRMGRRQYPAYGEECDVFRLRGPLVLVLFRR